MPINANNKKLSDQIKLNYSWSEELENWTICTRLEIFKYWKNGNIGTTTSKTTHKYKSNTQMFLLIDV